MLKKLTAAVPRLALSASAGESLLLPTKKTRWAYPSPAIGANLLSAVLIISLVNILAIIISDRKIRTYLFILKVKFILIKHGFEMQDGWTRMLPRESTGAAESSRPVCTL